MKPEVFTLCGEEEGSEPVRYRACGLDNIFLMNGYEIEQHDGESHISVKHVKGLHEEIGRHIVLTRKAMTAQELRFLRNTMGVTQADLARTLGTTAQSIARWEKAQCEMPGTAEKLLRTFFLMALLSDNELVALREFMTRTMDELDEVDELSSGPAQFRLGEHWTQEAALAA